MPSARDVVLQVVAQPREAGTREAARARALIGDHLRGLGYAVEEQPFGFPPSTLLALPFFGAGLACLALPEALLLLTPGVPAGAALLVWVLGLAGLTVLALGIGLGWVNPRGEVREDANLIATRGGRPVTRWIVAHYDAKLQGHSMAGRLIAVWTCLAVVLLIGGVAIWRWYEGVAVPTPTVALGTGLGVVSGVLAYRGRLRSAQAGTGARDNASGLLAALVAAGASNDPRTGIIITAAEEFGVVGARVLARQRGSLIAGADVLNLDTLDDTGRLYLVSHDAAGEALALRCQSEIGAADWRARCRRVPWGILVDSLPLARAGARAVTLSRLDWGTLRRIHTPRDCTTGLTWTTAERVGQWAARCDRLD